VLGTSDFNYQLPADQIAQDPLPDRAASRLLVLERQTGEIRHATFSAIVDLIGPEDALVLNVSRVIPARLLGTREGGSGKGTTGAPSEILLVRELEDGSWIAMGHPGGKLKPGRRVGFGDDSAVEIVEVLGGGLRRVKFVGALDARATLAKYGAVPLPPYIRRAPRPEDRERYQTVYAEHDGSVAAPTAGLHFTQALLDRIASSRTGLGSLKREIDGDTTVEQLKVDLPRIATDFRVYLLLAPQVNLVRGADAATAAAARLGQEAQRLQQLIDFARSRGKDVAAAQAALVAMQHDLANAGAQLSGLSAKLLALTPADWNDGRAKPVLDAARSAERSAHAELLSARRDAQAVIAALR